MLPGTFCLIPFKKDTLQTFIMIGGSIFLTVVSFRQVDGFSNMVKLFGQAVPVLASNSSTPPSCARPPEVTKL